MSKPSAAVQQYLDALPADRREAIEAIRATILKNLDPKFEEGIQYGMIGYYLPHSVYPDGYHCDPKQPLPFASLASQKNHIGIYLFCLYTDPEAVERFREEWVTAQGRIDMGKSCVRVKKLDDVPLKVLGKAIKQATAKKFVAAYEAARDGSWSKGKAAKKSAAKKSSTKKPVAKRPVAKKPTAKTAAAKKAARK